MTLPSALADLVTAAERRLGRHFQRPALLVEALTHRSYLNEQTEIFVPSNERLEFLGDAVLGFVVARYLFERYPDLPEGELTARRAALIRATTLAEWAHAFDFGSLLRVGQGETAGGPIRASLLADAFEAVLGAILLDDGLGAVEAFLQPLLDRQADEIVRRRTIENYKGKLQEVVQEREHQTPVYRTVSVEGPDHESIFTVEVVVGERVLARGAGRSKQSAQQDAARRALAAYLADGEERA